MRFRDQKDWRVTFFPPYALVVFILMSAPGALVLGWPQFRLMLAGC